MQFGPCVAGVREREEFAVRTHLAGENHVAGLELAPGWRGFPAADQHGVWAFLSRDGDLATGDGVRDAVALRGAPGATGQRHHDKGIRKTLHRTSSETKAERTARSPARPRRRTWPVCRMECFRVGARFVASTSSISAYNHETVTAQKRLHYISSRHNNVAWSSRLQTPVKDAEKILSRFRGIRSTATRDSRQTTMVLSCANRRAGKTPPEIKPEHDSAGKIRRGD